jgi:type IV pilus assembly protein PilE
MRAGGEPTKEAELSMVQNASSGFTLIEMLVAAVTAAILAAVALPNYADYIRRSRIVEATGKLAAMRIQLEQHYQDYLSYGSSAGGCGVPSPDGRYFSFSCNWGSVGSNQGYLITATGNAGSMSGFVYTIDQNGNRKTTGLPAAWGAPPYACWVQSKGGGC